MNLIKELMVLREAAAVTKVSFSCQCAAYNYPRYVTTKAEKELDANGQFDAKGASVAKYFDVKELNSVLKNKQFDKKIVKLYPDFYTDVTKIALTELSIGIDYADDEDYDDEDDEEQSAFPRTGSNGQDYVHGVFELTGLNPSKVSKKEDLEEIGFQIALHIGEMLYGQYCDEVDSDVM